MGEKLASISDQFIHWMCVNQWTPDVFNMGVHILAPNALEKSNGQTENN
jgi:hypothetical protein